MTLNAAVADVLRAAGFDGYARDVESGADPRPCLRQVRAWLRSEPDKLALIDEAHRLAVQELGPERLSIREYRQQNKEAD
jgi:hypothetical protein